MCLSLSTKKLSKIHIKTEKVKRFGLVLSKKSNEKDHLQVLKTQIIKCFPVIIPKQLKKFKINHLKIKSFYYFAFTQG